MQMPRNFDYKFLFVISIFSIIFGAIFGFLLFPNFLHHMLKSVSVVRIRLDLKTQLKWPLMVEFNFCWSFIQYDKMGHGYKTFKIIFKALKRHVSYINWNKDHTELIVSTPKIWISIFNCSEMNLCKHRTNKARQWKIWVYFNSTCYPHFKFIVQIYSMFNRLTLLNFYRIDFEFMYWIEIAYMISCERWKKTFLFYTWYFIFFLKKANLRNFCWLHIWGVLWLIFSFKVWKFNLICSKRH